MFEELGGVIREEVVLTLFHAQIQVEPEQPAPQQGNGNLVYEHETPAGADAISEAGSSAGSVGTSFAAQGGGTATATAVNDRKNVGRNDPCWCGSGKKFKKCHGA